MWFLQYWGRILIFSVDAQFRIKKNYVNVKQLSIKVTKIENKINIADQDEQEGQPGLNKEHMHQHVEEVHHIQTVYMTSSNGKK
jgi:hypothetical protein